MPKKTFLPPLSVFGIITQPLPRTVDALCAQCVQRLSAREVGDKGKGGRRRRRRGKERYYLRFASLLLSFATEADLGVIA